MAARLETLAVATSVTDTLVVPDSGRKRMADVAPLEQFYSPQISSDKPTEKWPPYEKRLVKPDGSLYMPNQGNRFGGETKLEAMGRKWRQLVNSQTSHSRPESERYFADRYTRVAQNRGGNPLDTVTEIMQRFRKGVKERFNIDIESHHVVLDHAVAQQVYYTESQFAATTGRYTTINGLKVYERIV